MMTDYVAVIVTQIDYGAVLRKISDDDLRAMTTGQRESLLSWGDREMCALVAFCGRCGRPTTHLARSCATSEWGQ
jgi:hypothetical protein